MRVVEDASHGAWIAPSETSSIHPCLKTFFLALHKRNDDLLACPDAHRLHACTLCLDVVQQNVISQDFYACLRVVTSNTAAGHVGQTPCNLI